MSVIMALLMFTCDLHINKEVCVDTHVECIKYMSSIKIGGLGCVTQEERLAGAYLYCVETGGRLNSDIDFSSMFNSLENYDGFQLWQKPNLLKN